jgi:hypothetical protein
MQSFYGLPEGGDQRQALYPMHLSGFPQQHKVPLLMTRKRPKAQKPLSQIEKMLFWA